MNHLKSIVAVMLLSIATIASAAEGLVSTKSPYGVMVTMDKFESLAKEKGLTIFARIDHAAGAKKVGKTLRPTELLIFGNPQGGTPFMECGQSVGIDLPLKVLVWEDSSSQVWLGYNDPMYLAKRHGISECPVVKKLSKALEGLAAAIAL